MNGAIEVESLRKTFPPKRRGVVGLRDLVDTLRGRRERVTALDGLSFEVRRGEIFGLLGPNGAGKTTLCKILNALVLPTEGSTRVMGLDCVRDHPAVTRRMVTVFGGEVEIFGIFVWRVSCERNLRFTGRLWRVPRAEAEKRMDEALDILGLGEKRSEWYQRLSAGQKQKLMLAIPLMVRPPVVVFDEPTTHLDVATRREIHRILREKLVGELGMTVLLTTHDMTEAERLCDRVAIIDRGRLLAIDAPRELARRLAPHAKLEIALLHPPERIEEALAGLEGVHAAIRGARTEDLAEFRLDLEPGARALAHVLAHLASNSVHIAHLHVREATLEEVFLHLTGREGEGKAAGASDA